MLYPTLQEMPSSKQMVDAFRGYNHNLRISDSEFYDMKNMTSDYYPVLSPRNKRGVYVSAANPRGLLAKDRLCFVDGSAIVIGDDWVEMGLTDDEKQLISMGAYIIILPDKKYINTLDLNDRGNIEAIYESTAAVRFELCTVSGEVYENATISDTAPEDPENMALWIDTSSKPHTLKKWYSSSSMWTAIATTYIRISSPGIGTRFKQYDGVTIEGVASEALKDLNASMVIWDRGDDYIVVIGLLDEVTTQEPEEGHVSVKRLMPRMDFVTESENRLWGCRYGLNDKGEMVNEIYACKQGDFRNWNCFMNTATDSYAASVGTDGAFTGAIAHLGYPLFFKENYAHKIFGNYPANYQIQTTACRGVQKGSHKSLAIVNEMLFYKSRTSVCAFDGSLPVEASYSLGNESYSDAVAGANGNKYYICMQDVYGVWHLFVYDTAKNMWHKEDNFHASGFCSWMGELYAIDADTKKIRTMLKAVDEPEEKVKWMVETGEIGITSSDMKYISRLTVRMSLDVGTEVRIFAKYDFSDQWEPLYARRSTSLRSFFVPLRPKRCDYMKLRIEGDGGGKIYTITKTIEQGSDVS